MKPKKRGIYLVANKKSEAFCLNLIYSIRQSGCTLPIKIIPFGGPKIDLDQTYTGVELIDLNMFAQGTLKLIDDLQEVLSDCPKGFLYRFATWFGDWDEFIYSDNDVVALCNWEILFDYLSDYDLVHADQEYLTNGIFNYDRPKSVEALFGDNALSSLFTAGHFAARRNEALVDNIYQAIELFNKHLDIFKKHDQTLLHVASLCGKWKILNLCKPPYNWLTTWAGDYSNALELVQKMQTGDSKNNISHLHYSGGTPSGAQPIQDLLFSNLNSKHRLSSLVTVGCKELSGYSYFVDKKNRLLKKLENKK